MAITEYNYIPKYIERTIANKPKDVVTASYWNELFNLLITQGDHTAKELGNILNHFTTVITDAASETADAIAQEHEYASAFEIHLNMGTNPITADKTFVEIRQAIVDKREILLWVSEVQCLKPTCKAFEHTITLTVFDYSFDGPVVRADVYECYDENEWFISQNIELAKQNDVGDIRDLTTAHKYNLVAAVNEVRAATDTKQDKLIAGKNITIADDGKTISATQVIEVALEAQSDGNYTANITFAQLKAEVASGKQLMLIKDESRVFVLNQVNNSAIEFLGADVLGVSYAKITAKANEVWEVESALTPNTSNISEIFSDIGVLANLTTDDKTHLVAAINEVNNNTDLALLRIDYDRSTKQDKLIAGENITIAADGKTISATGGGSDIETVESQLVDIPSKLSQLTNDAGYLTLNTLPKYDGSVT